MTQMRNRFRDLSPAWAIRHQVTGVWMVFVNGVPVSGVQGRLAFKTRTGAVKSFSNLIRKFVFYHYKKERTKPLTTILEELPTKVEFRYIDFSDTLDDQETHTVIAALRLYQQMGYGDPGFRPDSIHDLATNCGEVTSLDSRDIDRLIEEKIN